MFFEISITDKTQIANTKPISQLESTNFLQCMIVHGFLRIAHFDCLVTAIIKTLEQNYFLCQYLELINTIGAGPITAVSMAFFCHYF